MHDDPISKNVIGVSQLVTSRINKLSNNVNNNEEGIVGEQLDELTLKLDEPELIDLSNAREKAYSPYEGLLKPRQKENYQWYQGKQGTNSYLATNGKPIAANLLFEALETFLPATLAKNPEPVVYSDNTELGNKLSQDVKTMLQYHAETLAIRPKLKELVRTWSFDFLGVIKIGWDAKIKEVSVEVIDSKNLIFDLPSKIDCYCDSTSDVIGERKTCTASKLIDLFPEHKRYITVIVDGKLGTKIVYTEWWSDEYTFYTFRGKVLDKAKNPHFNYKKGAYNHFAAPKKPYIFLNNFSSPEQPHDVTNLLEQNIPNQNRISNRERQIDINLDRGNNSIALSGMYFNEQTAKQAAMALQKGNPVLVPGTDDVNKGMARFPAANIPSAVFQALENSKNDLRSSMGVIGLTATPEKPDTTVGGMVINEQHDGSRIGGGIAESTERVAKAIFNWLVQMYGVYYTEKHFATVMGQMKAVEYITLINTDLSKQFTISIVPDSMLPKDDVSEANESMALWNAKALDPKTLLTIRDFPDAQKTAEQAWLFQTNPQAYGALNFPDLTAKLAQLSAGQAQQAPPQGVENGGQPPQAVAPQV